MNKQPKKTSRDIAKQREAYFTKYEEYSKMTMEELKALFEHPDRKIRPGGIYKAALIQVYGEKKRDRDIKEAAERTLNQNPQTEPTNPIN